MSTEAERLQWCARSFRYLAERTASRRARTDFGAGDDLVVQNTIRRLLRGQGSLFRTRRTTEWLRIDDPDHSCEYSEILVAVERAIAEHGASIVALRRRLKGKAS